MATIYNHYRVKKAIITVTSNSASNNAIAGISLTDDSTVSGSYNGIRETKDTTMVALGPANSQANRTLTMTYDYDKIFKGSKLSPLTALYGTNPDENMFFDIWLQANLVGTSSTFLSFLVTITYIVESSEMKDLGVS